MKIIIIDDHAIVRSGLVKIVEELPGKPQIDEAGSGREGLEKIYENSYDVILLDIGLGDMNGLEVLATIKERGITSNILILSMHSEEHYAVKAFELGAAGYLTKDSASEELLDAIEKVSSGQKYISANIAPAIVGFLSNESNRMPHENLSEREFEVMIRIAKGESLSKIADELFISVKTVSTYRTRILSKLRMENNSEIIRYALRNGLIGSED